MTMTGLKENEWNLKNLLSLLFSLESLTVLCVFSYQYKNAHPIFTFFDITVFLNLILIVFTVIIYFREKDTSTVLLNKETIIFLIMAGWFILSTSWSPSHYYKIQKALCFIFYIIPIWFTGQIISKSPVRVERLLKIFALFSLIVIMEAFRAFYVNGMSSIQDILGANYLITGQTLGIGLIIFTANSIYRAENFNEISFWKSILLSSLIFYALLNIGGRGPVIAALVCVIGLYLVLLKKFSFQKTLNHFTAFIGTALSVYHVLNLLFQHKGAHFINRVTPLLHLPQTDNSLMERLDYYQSAFSAFWQNPFFGLGLGGWPLFRGLGDISYHPHNIFLEIMAETGLMGLLFFLSLIFLSLKGLKLNSILSSSPLGTMCFVTLFSFINACKTGDLHDNIVFFFALSLLAGLKTRISLKDHSLCISTPTTNKLS